MDELIHGDCLEALPKLRDGSVDMVLCDPPYGTTACKWDSIIPLDLMWEQLKRVIKPNGAIVMTSSQPFTTTLIASNMKMFKYCWVWDKRIAGSFLNANKQPLRRTEDVCIFYKKQCVYNPEMRHGVLRKKGGKNRKGDTMGDFKKIETYSDKYYPTNILEISNADRTKKVHPTQKPVSLMEYLIKTYTNEGETVLDFAMGSGTTGVACKNLARSFIGIEKDEDYYGIAIDRIASAQSLLTPMIQ